MTQKKTVAILCAGGPAPAINTVIATITKRFLSMGYRVIGLHYGYKTVFTDKPNFVDLSYVIADRIIDQRGCILKMSRYKPKDSEFTADFFVRENVVLLVTIGGDDTASTANRLCEYLRKNKVYLQNIHVPKTIDNDLPLPDEICTFGYQTAKHRGSELALVYLEEARTSDMWFVVSAMGREAGHLALGIGNACHYPVIIIPEMFGPKIYFRQVVKLIVSSIIKRKLMGHNFGGVIISEGIFHKIPLSQLKKAGIQLTYDEHNHPELGDLPKAHMIKFLLTNQLKKLGFKVKCRSVEIGYDVRCVNPIGFDLNYATNLGLCVVDLFKKKKTQCIAVVTPKGRFKALKMKDISNSEGVIIPRLVDISSNQVVNILASMELLTSEDRRAARKYLSHPETYIYNKKFPLK
jgi:6-phosphofructokinase 1